MTLPGALLGLIIASLVGLLYHLLRGGSLGRLLLYIVSACIAFFAGHWLGDLINWTSWRLGTLNLLPALLATVIILVLADILAGPRSRHAVKSRKPPRRDR